MGNIIKIKHGASVPGDATLALWEPGLDTVNNVLYINKSDDPTAKNLVGYLPLTAGENAALTGNLYLNGTNDPYLYFQKNGTTFLRLYGTTDSNNIDYGAVGLPSGARSIYYSSGNLYLYAGASGKIYLRPNNSDTNLVYLDTDGLHGNYTYYATSNGTDVSGVTGSGVSMLDLKVPRGCYVVTGEIECVNTSGSDPARCRINIAGFGLDIEVGGYGSSFSKAGVLTCIVRYNAETTISMTASVNGTVTVKNRYLRALRIGYY